MMLEGGTARPRELKAPMGLRSPAGAHGRARPAPTAEPVRPRVSTRCHKPFPGPSLPQRQRGAPTFKLKPNQKFSFQRT